MTAEKLARPKITVLIPCKDEAKNIAACIRSARLFADEVLVADSGSTDGTLAIAYELADRVIEREYIDSGDFKNWAIPQATNSWIFILDADERVTVELAKEVRSALEANVTASRPLLAFSVPRRNFFLGHPIDHGDWASDRVTRLISRDDCRYKLHTDHAEIDVPNKHEGKLASKLTHYTAWDLGVYLAKTQHYALQQARLWHKQQRRPELHHLVLNAPMRFLRGYVLKMGWRDGLLGFFIACLTAYYSFVKQFYFWQLCHGRSIEEFEQAEVPTAQAASRLERHDVEKSSAKAA